MTEKDMFLNTWEREFQTTIKVLRAFPADKPDFKPHEVSRSAKELAWTFVGEERLLNEISEGEIKMQPGPPAPGSFEEVLTIYNKSHKEIFEKIAAMSENDYNSTVKFFSGPGKMSDFRRADVCWMMLYDMIHHRGQFSVYLRMAGGKVPSIYGPSHDEPWN